MMRIGIPKGSLMRDSIEALLNAGLPAEALKDPGRHLMFFEDGYEFVIIRPTDIPTFVNAGGVDCAICGKDSIIESGLEVMELVDLGYGHCRFVVAEPEQKIEETKNIEDKELKGKLRIDKSLLSTRKVATKYPNITRAYYDSLGIQIEVVKMHGNIELAPYCNMADQVVDITATGATLRENKLKIVGEVLSSTARFISNPAKMRLNPQIRDLAIKLKQ